MLALHSFCSAFISLFSCCLALFFLPLCLAHMQGQWVWESEGWLIFCTPHRCLAIYGLPGNPFFCACVVERSRHCREATWWGPFYFLFSSVLFFRTMTSNLSTEVSSSSQGQILVQFYTGILGFIYSANNLRFDESGLDIHMCISILFLSHTQPHLNTSIYTVHVFHINTHMQYDKLIRATLITRQKS